MLKQLRQVWPVLAFLVLIVAAAFAFAIPDLIQSWQANHPRLRGDVLYPPGWPVAELSAPPDAQRAVVDHLTQDKDIEERCYSVMQLPERVVRYEAGFHSPSSYDAVIAHIDAELKPLDYRIKDDEPGSLRAYLSPDPGLMVFVSYNGDTGVWSLSVLTRSFRDGDPDIDVGRAAYADSRPIP